MANGREATLAALKNLAKTIFNKEENVELKFKDEKLTDGTIIRYDADMLAVGVKVSIVTESGEVLPMPVGSYETMDGTYFDVVSEDGSIDNVVTGSPEDSAAPTDANPNMPAMEEAKPSNPAVAPTQAPAAQPKAIVESIVKETRFEDEAKEKFTAIEKTIEEKYNDLVQKFNEQAKTVENLENNLKQMFSMVEAMGEQPAVEATEAKPNQFKKAMTAKEASKMFKEQLFNSNKDKK